MSRETVFYARIAEMTDEWMDLFGYLAPSVVTDTLEEYRAVREAAGLMDFSMLRKIDITGSGAVELVNSLVTRDIRRLQPGQIAYGALADENGMMVDDCTTSVLGDDSVRFCGANDRDLEMFTAKAAGTAVEVTHLTDDMPHLCLQGPKSRSILQGLCGADLSNASFPYYTFRRDIEVAGISVFMTRLGYTAELGFELWVERERALELFDALLEAGSSSGMRLIGMDALDLLRIEGGFIIGGIEYDSTVSPYECGLGWAVDLGKGSFLGREALVEAKERTELRLASVVLDSGGAGASGARLSHDDEDIGFVTQAITSPYLDGKTLGLAKVRRPHNTSGTEIVADIDGAAVPGRIVRHPVYDPERKRAKEKG
ncbi:MAG: aminomethyltransferase family protein [Actinomycetota bacterium]|nr:aminomethyltransferase family protein [Actinomycetota bacterium]